MTRLYPYQKEDVATIEQFQGRILVASEMGTGKTITALTYLKNHPELRPAIIVCPASLKWVWELQARQHCSLHITILSGRKLPKKKFLKQKAIYVLNYDILDAWKDYLRKLLPQAVIGDEIHACKSPKAKRTKAFKALCKGIKHVIAISGTPLTNRPAELFPVLNILWPESFPHFWPYAQRHCAVKLRPWGWDVRGASHLKELHQKLLRLGMLRRLKKDVLKDLPEKTRVVVPMDIERPTEYKRAVNDFIGWLGDQSAAKANRARKAEELTKIGYLVRLAAELKMKAVFEWVDNFLEGTDEKLVLFCCHKKIVRALRERYKGISTELTGATTEKNRKAAEENFQKNPKCRVFVGQIKAAGVGIDLWAASNVGFVEMGWVSGDIAQAVDRLHRIGQTKHVFAHFFVGKDTIETDLCRILQEKQEVITKVLDGKEKRKENKLDIYKQLLKIVQKGKK